MNGSTKPTRSRAGWAAAPVASVTVSRSATPARLDLLNNLINMFGHLRLPHDRPAEPTLLPSPRQVAGRTRIDDKQPCRLRTIGRFRQPAHHGAPMLPRT